MKKCKKCGETKPLEEFYKCTTNKDGHKGYCKVCQSAISRDWWADNADKRKAKRTAATQCTDASIINLWRPIRSNI